MQRNKSDSGMGMGPGMVAMMAICCGGKLLLLLGLGLPALALSTGQTVLIALASVVAIAAVGLFLWRRRSSGCAVSTCAPRTTEHRQAAELDRVDPTTEREPIGAGREHRP